MATMDGALEHDLSSLSSGSSDKTATLAPISRTKDDVYSYNSAHRPSTIALLESFPRLFDAPLCVCVQMYADLDAQLTLAPNQVSADQHVLNSFKRALLSTHIASLCSRSYAFHDELGVMLFRLVQQHIAHNRQMSSFRAHASLFNLARSVAAYSALMDYIEDTFPSVQIREQTHVELYKRVMEANSSLIPQLFVSVDRRKHADVLASIASQVRASRKRSLLKSILAATKAHLHNLYSDKYGRLARQLTPLQLLSAIVRDHGAELQLLHAVFGARECERMSHHLAGALFGDAVCAHVRAYPQLWKAVLTGGARAEDTTVRRVLRAMMPDVLARLKESVAS